MTNGWTIDMEIVRSRLHVRNIPDEVRTNIEPILLNDKVNFILRNPNITDRSYLSGGITSLGVSVFWLQNGLPQGRGNPAIRIGEDPNGYPMFEYEFDYPGPKEIRLQGNFDMNIPDDQDYVPPSRIRGSRTTFRQIVIRRLISVTRNPVEVLDALRNENPNDSTIIEAIDTYLIRQRRAIEGARSSQQIPSPTARRRRRQLEGEPEDPYGEIRNEISRNVRLWLNQIQYQNRTRPRFPGLIMPHNHPAPDILNRLSNRIMRQTSLGLSQDEEFYLRVWSETLQSQGIERRLQQSIPPRGSIDERIRNRFVWDWEISNSGSHHITVRYTHGLDRSPRDSSIFGTRIPTVSYRYHNRDELIVQFTGGDPIVVSAGSLIEESRAQARRNLLNVLLLGLDIVGLGPGRLIEVWASFFLRHSFSLVSRSGNRIRRLLTGRTRQTRQTSGRQRQTPDRNVSNRMNNPDSTSIGPSQRGATNRNRINRRTGSSDTRYWVEEPAPQGPVSTTGSLSASDPNVRPGLTEMVENIDDWAYNRERFTRITAEFDAWEEEWNDYVEDLEPFSDPLGEIIDNESIEAEYWAEYWAEVGVLEGTHQISSSARPRYSIFPTRPSVILRRNMRIQVPEPANSQAHHIVPIFDRRGSIARRILAIVGIDINDASNGVFLTQTRQVGTDIALTRHANIHTTSYYQRLTRDLIEAYSTSPTSSSIRSKLAEIRDLIQDGAYTHGRP